MCFKGERPLIARSLAALEARLDPAIFFRNSRAQIVNLKWVEKVETGAASNLEITLRSGQTIAASRRQLYCSERSALRAVAHALVRAASPLVAPLKSSATPAFSLDVRPVPLPSPDRQGGDKLQFVNTVKTF